MNSNSISSYKIIMAILGTLIAGLVFWYFHTIIYYILGAAAVSFIGGPLVRLIEKFSIAGRSIPRWFSAMVVLMGLLALFLGLCAWLIPSVSSNVEYMRDIDHTFVGSVFTGELGKVDEWIHDTWGLEGFSLKEVIQNRVLPIFSSENLGSMLTGVTDFVLEFVAAIFSISFISYFFLKDDKLFANLVVAILPKRYEQNVIRAIDSSVNLLGRYFIGICIESLIKFLMVGFALYFLGMSFSVAMIIGLITAGLNVIPYVGPLIGALIAIAISLLQPEIILSSPLEVVIEVSVVLGVFQLFDNIILQPYIYSSSVKAHPLEIFIVILMSGYVGGVVGMLLAIPFYTVVRVFAKEFFANLRVVQKLTENL